MNFMKKTLPVLISFVLGCFVVILDYIPHKSSEELSSTLAKGLIIITAVTIFLGLYYLLHLHYFKIKRKHEGWGYSLFVWLGFMVMTILGVYNDGLWFWNNQVEGGGVSWVYSYIFTPCQATMYSMLAFFIASAAYRGFRAKSWEAAILLIAAVLVMFGSIPISESVWGGFSTIAEWLLEYPNLAVKRAIFFGIALGGVSTSLKIIFGIERSYLGGE